MTKHLLTWYGITDLRASLGLETSNGPILSALLAEPYSDVVILAYSNSDKEKNVSEKKFIQELKIIDMKNSQSIWDFINKFSNTEAAHNHFKTWLKEQLEIKGLQVKTTLNPVFLKYLNDTESIYEAAKQSLDVISNDKNKGLVTLYLSPGTPVMAFVWSFAALSHPELKKRMIASPHPNKPPEVISLPNEWLEWYGKKLNINTSNNEQFDVIFHLFGEQRIPNLLGVLQFTSKVHVFVSSKQFSAKVMKQFLPNKEGFYEIQIDPFDPEGVRATILEKIEELPSNVRIGFNLTGGTKLMYAGALNACRKVNATPFYFDSRNSKVIFLNDFKSEKIKPINSVETFIKLNGNDLNISKDGFWKDIPNIDNPDRRNLTHKLWQFKSRIAKLYGELCNYNDEKRLKPFDINKAGISVSLKDNKQAEIIFTNKKGKDFKFSFNNWPDFAIYLSGGWLEEYTYMLLEPFVKTGQIKDIRIGLEISFKEKTSDKPTQTNSSMAEQLSSHLSNSSDFQGVFSDSYQELDVVFTDGQRLYIIECKAGSVKTEHIMKLQNIVRYFGGIEGKGVLAACFEPRRKVVVKKIKDARNSQLITGRTFKEDIEAFVHRITRK